MSNFESSKPILIQIPFSSADSPISHVDFSQIPKKFGGSLRLKNCDSTYCNFPNSKLRHD